MKRTTSPSRRKWRLFEPLGCISGGPVACVTVAGEGTAIRVVLRLQGCDMWIERCERGEELVWRWRASTIDAFAGGLWKELIRECTYRLERLMVSVLSERT